MLQEKCRLKNIKVREDTTVDNRVFLDINGLAVKIIDETSYKRGIKSVKWGTIVERVTPFINNAFLTQKPHLIVLSKELINLTYIREFEDAIFSKLNLKLFFIDFKEKDCFKKLLAEINKFINKNEF
ncbi:MAG: hypothetical protein OdinLCB4_002830 [Candidatus Odinarchaeum yellowstonii]|uniref:Uncharacterized protein n=1 Tax=Odinarchaeota yellowstonii (strain LCB_4) TaxID=1841599 RepID=A0AAF0D3A5_ODILC|nr:MAG: hypothetical protein OdinLCB4_002830 [Candidatus Odinarchaeum yellowstonii]